MNVHDSTPTMAISIQTKNLVVVNCKLLNFIGQPGFNNANDIRTGASASAILCMKAEEVRGKIRSTYHEQSCKARIVVCSLPVMVHS